MDLAKDDLTRCKKRLDEVMGKNAPAPPPPRVSLSPSAEEVSNENGMEDSDSAGSGEQSFDGTKPAGDSDVLDACKDIDNLPTYC